MGPCPFLPPEGAPAGMLRGRTGCARQPSRCVIESETSLVAYVEHRADVRWLSDAIALEARARIDIAEAVRGKDLDCDVTVEPVVTGSVHLAYAASVEERVAIIGAEQGTRWECGRPVANGSPTTSPRASPTSSASTSARSDQSGSQTLARYAGRSAAGRSSAA